MKAQGDDKNVFDIEQGVSITFLVKLPTAGSSPGHQVDETFELTAPEPGKTKKSKHRQLEGGKVTLKARVHQADLWGSRDYKYDWLATHGLPDTPWQALQPALPQLLLVPRDETDAVEYERGWKVTDIFPMNGTGVITKCDQLNISFSAKECFDKVSWLLTTTEADARQRFRLPKLGVRDWSFGAAVSDVKSSGPNQLFVKPVLYRPFDQRYLYYTGRSKGLMGWPVHKLFRHFSESPNIGLITSRLTKGESFAHAQITDKITEVICMSPQTSNNGFVFPLWLLPEQGQPGQPLHNQRHPNLAPGFLAALAQALDRPVTGPHGLPEGVTPEDVLAYVYAVLHAPSYRSRYGGFLKSDFPRIPLPNQAVAPVNTALSAAKFVAIWSALLPLGKQLIDLHLLENVPVALRPRFAMQGSNEVEKPRFEQCDDRGRVWINTTQYFDGVPVDTWSFKIGGYQVCEKWLKDRKGRQLDFADIQHYGTVVAALTRTRELMLEIDTVANGRLWPEATGTL